MPIEHGIIVGGELTLLFALCFVQWSFGPVRWRSMLHRRI